jgi:hypothetical protein
VGFFLYNIYAKKSLRLCLQVKKRIILAAGKTNKKEKIV